MIKIYIPESALELYWLEFNVDRFPLSLVCGCLIFRLLVWLTYKNIEIFEYIFKIKYNLKPIILIYFNLT